MKKPGIILAVTLFVFSGSKVAAQESVQDIKPDKSPADISYYRGENKEALAKVVYSRPAKNGRTIFGELVPYGEVWRTGANENTEIRFNTDVTFGGENVPAGTYSLFTVPEEGNWTVILNSAVDQWGAYSYDEGKDVIRIEAAAAETAAPVELLTIYFEGEGASETNLVIAWDNKVAKVPVAFQQ